MISGVCRNGAARDAGVVSAVLRVLSLRSCATSSCGALQLFFTAKNESRSPRACTYAAAKARFGVAVLCMRYGIPVPVDRIVPVAEIRGPSNELDQRIITGVITTTPKTHHNNQIVRSACLSRVRSRLRDGLEHAIQVLAAPHEAQRSRIRGRHAHGQVQRALRDVESRPRH